MNTAEANLFIFLDISGMVTVLLQQNFFSVFSGFLHQSSECYFKSYFC